jgi:putative transposase
MDAEQLKIARDDEKKLEQAAKRKKVEEQRDESVAADTPARRENKVYANPMRARRIRLYPTKEQEEKLGRFFGAVRFCYNLLVEKYPVVGQGGIKLADMRATIAAGPEWLKEIPYDIKDGAVDDFVKAHKAHFAKLKKKRKNDPAARHDAKFKFRSKRDQQQSFEVRPRDLERKTGAMAFLNLSSLRGAEHIPEEAEAAARFVRDRLGRYFLVLPRQVARRSETQAPSSHEGVVALDPGVRTFQTTYDADGLATEWGKDDMKQIYRLCRVADKLQSAWIAKRTSKRRATKLAWHRVLDRIKNLVKELHRKMATWLCETYKVVLIPVFETSRMVSRGGRKINSKTARSMLTWSHYAFRALLKAKAELYPWVRVIECNEAFRHTRIKGSVMVLAVGDTSLCPTLLSVTLAVAGSVSGRRLVACHSQVMTT